MNRHIQAIFEKGILRPLNPLDLPENSIVELDLRESADKSDDVAASVEAFDKWIEQLKPDTPVLTDAQQSRESIYRDDTERRI